MELKVIDLFLVLGVALAAGRLAIRFGYPSVLGELMAGIVLGPPILGWLSGSDALSVLAELGVMLMMVYIGMEIDLGDLRRASTTGLLAAIGGFVVPFAGGYFVTVAFGYSAMAGLFIGMAVGVTSLATKSRILVDLDILDTRIAHVLMAGALVADTLSLMVFAGIISAASSGTFQLTALGLVSLRIVGFFVASWLVGSYVIPRIFALVGRRTGAERTLNLTLTVLVVLLYAEMAEIAGLHGVLGAFLAGLFLREGIRVRRMSHEITEVVRDVSLGFLAPVFFVSAGFGVSFSVFRDAPGFLAAVVAVAVIGKIVGTTLFYLPSGHGWREGLTVGAGMNGRGAVEIIIAGIGLQQGIIGQEVFSTLVFMAIFTTATVPVSLKAGVEWLRRRGELTRSDPATQPVFIVGAGAIARILAIRLQGSLQVTLMDLNPVNVVRAREYGLEAVQGDGLDLGALRRAGIEECGTVVALTPNPAVNVLIAQRTREEFLIPSVRAMVTPDSDAGLLEVLDSVGGAVLFGEPIDFVQWEGVAQAQPMTPDLTEIDADTMQRGGWEGLPLLTEVEGVTRIYDGSEVGAGGNALVLRGSSQPERT
jgi:Kef-type K+ transport system membrane component KefB